MNTLLFCSALVSLLFSGFCRPWWVTTLKFNCLFVNSNLFSLRVMLFNVTYLGWSCVLRRLLLGWRVAVVVYWYSRHQTLIDVTLMKINLTECQLFIIWPGPAHTEYAGRNQTKQNSPTFAPQDSRIEQVKYLSSRYFGIIFQGSNHVSWIF